MRFSQAILAKIDAIKDDSRMIALFPDKESIKKLVQFQKEFNLDRADEVLKPEDMHLTLRYWGASDFDGDKLIKQFLNRNGEHSNFSAKVLHTGILGEGALVLHLKSKEIKDLQEKIDDGIQEIGVPKSDYNTFRCHISLAYGYKDVPNAQPDFDELTFDKIKFTQYKDEKTTTLWEL